ncbi:hypothetical protein CLF_101160 [Clonorchis sinensis]|uniref:EF-hand domain-containing protein n=1 Tax=Clonorchis sinensis TaxID=79923 RepID=G7Y560_CLOSI|nr:hypothetical protein CLF_101160 [Clonorchis sinensis]
MNCRGCYIRSCLTHEGLDNYIRQSIRPWPSLLKDTDISRIHARKQNGGWVTQLQLFRHRGKRLWRNCCLCSAGKYFIFETFVNFIKTLTENMTSSPTKNRIPTDLEETFEEERKEVPSEWRMWTIAPIFKKGRPTLCENQSGISLVAIPSKMLSGRILRSCCLQRMAFPVDLPNGKFTSTSVLTHLLYQLLLLMRAYLPPPSRTIGERNCCSHGQSDFRSPLPGLWKDFRRLHKQYATLKLFLYLMCFAMTTAIDEEWATDAVQKLMNEIDTNQDGFVDAQELREYLHKSNYKMSEQQIAELIVRLDKNGDGLLDAKEIAEFIFTMK